MADTRIVQASVDALVERAHREIDEGLLASCQLALGLDGEVVEQVTLGDSLGDDSRYVIFSATKGLVYATTWQLLVEGSMRLDQRVADVLTGFEKNGKGGVTVEQVMCHRGGFPQAPLGPPAWTDRDARLAQMADWRLTTEPGTFQYHTTAAHWVLAEMIQEIDGIDFRDAVRRRVFEPLGLERTALGVAPEHQDDINKVRLVGEPATEEEFMAAIGVPGIDTGEVTWDALARFAEPEAIALGLPGAGAVSTAGDMARFYQALLHNRGGLWDPHWLHEATSVVRVDELDLLFGVPANRTIGMVVAGDDGGGAARGFGHSAGPRTFGYNGVGGQVAWADPDTGLSFSYLTDGMDRNILRQSRRVAGVSSRAAVCAPSPAVA